MTRRLALHLLHEGENPAILNDHFAIVFRRADELDTVVEADAILDDGAKPQSLSMVRKAEFQSNLLPDLKVSGNKQLHAAIADVATGSMGDGRLAGQAHLDSHFHLESLGLALLQLRGVFAQFPSNARKKVCRHILHEASASGIGGVGRQADGQLTQ